MPPCTAWGQTYYCGDLALKTSYDLIRIISNYSGTTHVWANGVAVTSSYPGATPAPSSTGLAGRTYTEIPLPDNTGMVITADQPIYVVEESVGGVCDNTSSDPMYINMMPEEQWGQYYSFSTPTNMFLPPYGISFINVVKYGNTPGTGTLVTLDGVEISPSLYSQIGSTGFYYVKYPVSPGYHLVIGSQPMMVYVYGFSSADAYGWPAAGAGVHPVLLPVTLGAFTGKKEGATTLLNWTTATETGNNYFSIERAPDGESFAPIGSVKGTGNSTVPLNYSFTDKQPITGNNYYRLKQVDYNGKSSYSNIVVINFGGGSFRLNWLRPVPASEKVTLSLDVESDGNCAYAVYDMTGRKVLNGVYTGMHTGNNVNDLDITLLGKGVYVIALEKDGEKIMSKLVKY